MVSYRLSTMDSNRTLQIRWRRMICFPTQITQMLIGVVGQLFWCEVSESGSHALPISGLFETGYFTTRPNFKRMERRASNIMQAARQLEVGICPSLDTAMRMYSLTSFLLYRSLLVVVQWKEELRILWIILKELSGSLSTMMVGKGETCIHIQGCEHLSRWYRALMWFLSPLYRVYVSTIKAITGNNKQLVADDYSRRLAAGIIEVDIWEWRYADLLRHSFLQCNLSL